MTDINKYNNTARYAGLATQWLAMLGLAVWIGLKLDKLTGWRFPVFVITLPLAALCFSLWQLVREFNKPKK